MDALALPFLALTIGALVTYCIWATYRRDKRK